MINSLIDHQRWLLSKSHQRQYYNFGNNIGQAVVVVNDDNNHTIEFFQQQLRCKHQSVNYGKSGTPEHLKLNSSILYLFRHSLKNDIFFSFRNKFW